MAQVLGHYTKAIFLCQKHRAGDAAFSLGYVCIPSWPFACNSRLQVSGKLAKHRSIYLTLHLHMSYNISVDNIDKDDMTI